MDTCKKRILLVEDDAILALSEKLDLEKFGYEVQHVSTGEKAVQAILANDTIDLILMDINLGRGIDGTQAAEQILESKNVPIIFLSSHTDPDIVRRTERITSYGYVVKNSGIVILDTSIKMALRLFIANLERDRTLQNLREVEDRHYRLFTTMTAGVVYQSAPDGAIVSANKAAEKLLGISFDDMRGKTSVDPQWIMVDMAGNFIPGTDHPSMMSLATGKQVGPVIRGIRTPEQDSFTWLSITAIPLFKNGEDTPFQVYAIFDDITEQFTAQKKLWDSEKVLRDIFESLLAGYWDWNIAESTEYLSPTFKRMFGYEDHELANSPETWQQLIFQEDLPPVLDMFNRHVATHGESPYYTEVRYHHKNGSAVWVICAGRVIEWAEDGSPIRMVGCHIDITNRRQIEEDLKQSEARLAALFQSTTELVVLHKIVYDEHGIPINYRIINCNKAYTEITGIAREDAIGRLATEVYGTAEPPYFAEYVEVAETGKFIQYETYFQPMNKHFRISAVSLGDNKDSFATITTDITASKQAEERLRSQVSEKEALLQEVHHRVKNNIVNIESFLSMQIGSTSSPEVATALQEAVSRVQSMRILYEKLLVARDYDVIAIHEYTENLIDSLHQIFVTDGDVVIERQIVDFEIEAKKALSIGIIVNELLTNAFKYAFKNRSEKKKISVSLQKGEDDTAALVVWDNGDGFDDRALANKTSGFGLTIVKMLAEQLGGKYTVVNENGAKSIIQFKVK